MPRQSPETVPIARGNGFLLGKLPGEFPNPPDNFRESLRQTHNFVTEDPVSLMPPPTNSMLTGLISLCELR